MERSHQVQKRRNRSERERKHRRNQKPGENTRRRQTVNRNANGGIKAPQITARNNARADAKHWYSRNAIEKQALDVERAHLVWKQAWKHIGQALLERRQLREKAKAKAANQGPGNLTVNESKGGVVNQREA